MNLKNLILASLSCSLAQANVFFGQCEFQSANSMMVTNPDLEYMQGMWYEIYTEENYLTD